VKEPVGPPKVLKFANEKQHKMMFTLREGHHGLPTGKRVLQIGGSSSVKVARDESSFMRRKDVVFREKDEDSDYEEQSKPRLMWDTELHNRFLVALALLGDGKERGRVTSKIFELIDIFICQLILCTYFLDADAVPTSIIGIMNVVGLTTKQVASHLQVCIVSFCKLNSIKMSDTEQQKNVLKCRNIVNGWQRKID